MKLRHIIFISLGVSVAIISCSALQTIPPTTLSISNRVDTTNLEVKDIVQLYTNYLNSSPEIIGDNPYWNVKEKQQLIDFDLSRSSLFQSFTGKEIQRYYPPFIMSVDTVGEKYKIKVLYSSNTTDLKYIGSKVWAIHQLYAFQENGAWVLENSLPNITSGWNRKSTELINFIYPHSHQFSEELSQKATEFCKSFIDQYNPEKRTLPFNYYITNDVDLMGTLENFDYYFVGITNGKSKEGMVLTAKGNEFYPHEFVHQLLPVNEKRGHIIEEGLATYLGTRTSIDEYRLTMKRLGADLSSDSRINFHSIFDHAVTFNGYQIAYPAGAAICELVADLKGNNGINELINSDTSTKPKLLESLTKILNMSENEIKIKWRQLLIKYSTL